MRARRTPISVLLASALTLLAVLVWPAHATAIISCQATDGSGASVVLGIGAGPKLNPIDVRINVGGAQWSSISGEPGTPMLIFQAFSEPGRLSIDLTDPNVVDLIAEIRLVHAEEMKSFAQAGLLRLVGHGVYALSCEGP